MVPASEYKSSLLRRTLQHLCINCNSGIIRFQYFLLFFFLILSANLRAQIPITLNSAIDSAIANNRTVNNERLKTEQAKALIRSAVNIPLTNIAGDFGQINSSYFDTKVGISQSFNFPTVYAKQKQLFTNEWEAAMLNVSLKETEIKKAVTETFYNYLYWTEKQKLLTGIDSLYSTLLQKANLRLQKGESNVLEKTTFESQKAAIQVQQLQVQQETEIMEQLFRLLLNTKTNYVPQNVIFKMQEPLIAGLYASIDNHPELRLISQQQEVAKANTSVEKSKLLPDLLLGYNNSSMRGMGADEKLYSSSNRFHTMMVGIGFPIFASAQKARIKASRIHEQVAINNYNIEKESLKTKLANALTQYTQSKQAVALYENKYLKNADIIKEAANKQFLNGEINYLDFVVLINQQINIQNSYIDAVQSLNQSTILLNYLMNK